MRISIHEIQFKVNEKRLNGVNSFITDENKTILNDSQIVDKEN